LILGARFWAAWLVAGFALGLALSLVWWALLEPAAAGNKVAELIIPRGTADAVARGEPAPFIPNSLSLGRNRELRVRNDDVVAHKVGASTVPPGDTAVIKAAADSKDLVCTVHPAGYVGVRLDSRPGFDTVVLQAALLGLPLGLVAGSSVLVGRRLSMDEEIPTPTWP
jgi:hypothetical protein